MSGFIKCQYSFIRCGSFAGLLMAVGIKTKSVGKLIKITEFRYNCSNSFIFTFSFGYKFVVLILHHSKKFRLSSDNLRSVWHIGKHGFKIAFNSFHKILLIYMWCYYLRIKCSITSLVKVHSSQRAL